MDVAVGWELPPACRRFFASPSASFSRHGWKRSAVRASTASHNCCKTELQSLTTGMSMLRAELPHLLGIDVVARDLGTGAKMRRQRVADQIVGARAEDDDQIGLAERVVAHCQVGIEVVVGDDAAPLPCGFIAKLLVAG